MLRLCVRRRRRSLLTLVGVVCLTLCAFLVVSMPTQERARGEPRAGYDIYEDVAGHFQQFSTNQEVFPDSLIENSLHAPSLPKKRPVVFNKNIPIHTKHLPLAPSNTGQLLSDGDVRGYEEVADAAVFDEARQEYENDEGEDEYTEDEDEEEDIDDGDEYYDDDDDDTDLLEDDYYEDDNPTFKTGDFDAMPVKKIDAPLAPANDMQSDGTNVENTSISELTEKEDYDKRLPSENEDILQNLAVDASHLHNSDNNRGDVEKVSCEGNTCLEDGNNDDKIRHDHKLKIDDDREYHNDQIGPPLMDNADPVEQESASPYDSTLVMNSSAVKNDRGFAVVSDGVYWSSDVEHVVPHGLSEQAVSVFRDHVREVPVGEMHPPQWNHCGRRKNQFVVLADGTKMCARYRDPHIKLIQGEVLSFYLSRLLGLDCVPTVVLSRVDTGALQWKKQNISAAQWEEGKLVALIQWIDNLEAEQSRVKMPDIVLSAYESGSPIGNNHPGLAAMGVEQLVELLQWGDMVIFDYITGHYDRVASMQDGAEREQRPSVMSERIRNLRQTPHNRKFWLIDNESGLLDAYELLYKSMTKKFITFHRKMLETMCIFHRSVARKVELLAGHSDPVQMLLQHTAKYEPLYEQLPKVASNHVFIQHFKERLKDVHDWIGSCKNRTVKSI